MQLSDSDKKTLYEAADILRSALATDGDTVTLRGFGTFTRKTVGPKQGRNPQTGGTVQIPARSVLRFKASSATAVSK